MRFELTDPCGSTVFKTVAINRTRPHFHNLVSVAGIEPTLERPKRSVIPFHHTEINLTWYCMRYKWNISRTIFLFKKLFSFLYIRCKDFFFLLTFWCSNCCFIHWHIILLFGCGGRIRTADLQVMSLMSYYFSTPRNSFTHYLS